MKRFKFFGLIMIFFTFSCEKNVLEKGIVSNSSKFSGGRSSANDVEKVFDQKSNLKREFGKALVKAMQESQLLRGIIKKEALKEINRDSDVLFAFIKDEIVEGGQSVEKLILKHFTDKKLLRELLSDCPTVTIFIPELPENSFNSNVWDTQTVVPRVAIRLNSTNDMPIIDLNGSETILSSEYTPGFPVLVIKENESIVAEVEKGKGYDKLKTRTLVNKKGEKFKFSDDSYDKSRDSKSRLGISADFDPKLITAYNTYLNTDGWQRDYVYYNISPTQNRGSVNVNFKEYIKSFRMIGDPIAAYNKISDQTGDPSYSSSTRNPSSPWTEGTFDFKVKILINKRNGTTETLDKGFGILGKDLFEVTYVKDYWLFGWVYKVSNVQLKPYTSISIPLFTWDLYEMASQIKMSFEEYDPSQTITNNLSVTADIANNFEVTGAIEKVGLKYGLNSKIALTKSHSVVTTLGNDQLGDILVNFGEKVIESKLVVAGLTTYTTKEQSTGYCSVSIEPRQN